MQHPVFDFLGSSLVPELGSDIATSAAGNEQCVGVAITAIWAFPDKFSFFIGFYLNLAVVSAGLAEIAFRIEFRVHDIFVYMPHYRKYRRYVVLHIRHFHIADGTAGRQFLKFRFKCQFIKRVNWLGHVNMVTIGNIVFIRHAFDPSKPLLQAFGKFVGR